MNGLIRYSVMTFLVAMSTCAAQDSSRVGYYNVVHETSTSTIVLLPPDTSGGKPLMQCLKHRRTSRSFDSKPLPQQVLSNLLWAAFGVNRPDGRRTAPSAMNRQDIDIYVAMQDGLYLYDAPSNLLRQLTKEDIREKTGTQGFVKDAPLDIVYVADLSKMGKVSADDQTLYAAADCGVIVQNVYLYCASEDLACVVRASIDRPALSKAMNLRTDQKIILSQTVGYPK
ncbi:MAG TPA: nitroreductase family protein [Candidatus Acidoferrales bacterium]|nr:nitroreductase family protein [Candidatus Acidoferrales bacterium]